MEVHTTQPCRAVCNTISVRHFALYINVCVCVCVCVRLLILSGVLLLHVHTHYIDTCLHIFIRAYVRNTYIHNTYIRMYVQNT